MSDTETSERELVEEFVKAACQIRADDDWTETPGDRAAKAIRMILPYVDFDPWWWGYCFGDVVLFPYSSQIAVGRWDGEARIEWTISEEQLRDWLPS